MPATARPSVQKGFDYTILDAETCQFIQRQTGEIRALMKRTAQDIIEIGQKLILVKEKLAHGRFLDWIAAEFEWSYPTAARFMQVANSFSKIYQIDKFAASALYVLAAPSTPETARSEAIARADAGEPITYTIAKEIKQKHSTSPGKLKPEPVALSKPIPALVPAAESRPNLEIVAIRPTVEIHPVPLAEVKFAEVQPKIEVPKAAPALNIPKPSQPISKPSEQPGIWWQLGRRHFLYCGDPNSPEFLHRIPSPVGLLLAFPPAANWHSGVKAESSIIATRHLPQGKDVRLFEDTLESSILLYTELGETVVICFLPCPEILSTINRLDRRGIFAEPDPKRVNEIISDWKAGGLKAERIAI